eukprot:scaffold3837_cov110-Isochrysis_galbana.AAC.13
MLKTARGPRSSKKELVGPQWTDPFASTVLQQNLDPPAVKLAATTCAARPSSPAHMRQAFQVTWTASMGTEVGLTPLAESAMRTPCASSHRMFPSRKFRSGSEDAAQSPAVSGRASQLDIAEARRIPEIPCGVLACACVMKMARFENLQSVEFYFPIFEFSEWLENHLQKIFDKSQTNKLRSGHLAFFLSRSGLCPSLRLGLTNLLN